MANIKDLKKKIKSVKGILKITTAMKLVASAKLARAQRAIRMSKPFANELKDTIDTISVLLENYSHYYLEESGSKKAVLLVLSSERGLCGGYNSQLGKAVVNFIKENSEFDFDVYFVGRKVKELIYKKVNFVKQFQFEKVEPSFDEYRKVTKDLAKIFSTPEVGKLFVAYNSFKSTISFDSTIRQVLPFTLEGNEKERIHEQYPFDFKYEPNAKEILDSLIPEAYFSTMYTCLLDGVASEHSARMTAMDAATINCKEAIRSKTIEMNKLRQAAITTELIEVVSGAESLKA